MFIKVGHFYKLQYKHCSVKKNKDKNVYFYAVRGEKIERGEKETKR